MDHVEYPKISAPVDAGAGAEIVDGTLAESIGSVKANGDGDAVEHTAESLSKSIGSPRSASPDAAPSKGYGLKKWRRIRRDLGRDTVSGADSTQILKRRLSLAEPMKIRHDSKPKSHDAKGEASVSVSVASNMEVNSTTTVATGVLDPELVLLVASSGFSVGADSDNSEDRSSKSSTAASAPRLRHEIGFGRERSWGKSSGGRGLGLAVQQRSQRGRGGGIDASKKFRGDQLRLEKENSQSSIESDLRSSNAAFARWGSVVSSNGKQSERSINDDGEHSDEAQTCEEFRSGYYKENGRLGDSFGEDLDADPLEEENIQKSKNGRKDFDPFIETIILLQAAQEALETEMEKVEEIGKELMLDGSKDQHEGTRGSSSPILEGHFLELNQKIKQLENKLEAASATVKAKELKVAELESILNRTYLPKKETGSTDLPPTQENRKEMEIELESLFKRKIEAEVECSIITRATQSLKALVGDQAALFELQNSLAEDQAQVMAKLKSTENKAAMLKEQVEELEARCKDMLRNEEVLRLQNKVCESSLFCFVQLVMFCIAFWWLIVQLLSLSEGVVPT